MTAVGFRRDDHATHLYPQRVCTNFANKWQSKAAFETCIREELVRLSAATVTMLTEVTTSLRVTLRRQMHFKSSESHINLLYDNAT
jgi:hypothetical protein